jgi:type IV pilus assembly protein PilP
MNKKIAASLFLTTLLSGCFSDSSEKTKSAESLVEKARAIGASFAEPIDDLESYKSVNYEAFDKKSPFEKFFDEKIVNSKKNAFKPDLTREREYLEQFDLSQLKINGIVASKGQRTVVIFDGKSNHLLDVGHYLGKNFGRITAISEKSIVLEEILKEDGINSWLKKEIELRMSDVTSSMLKE